MFWGIEQARALDHVKPPANAQAVAVKVDLNLPNAPWGAEGLGNGIRSLQARGERCDVDLEVGGEVFPAHQIMLASMSKAFRTFLQHLRVTGDSVESTDQSMAGILSVAQPPPPAPQAADAVATAPAAPAAEGATPVAVEAPAAAPDAPATEAGTSAAEAEGGSPKRLKLHLSGISRPESLQILLNYIYQVGTGMPWVYKPSCVQVNKDVLHLARHFQLDHLHEYAARWLIDGLSTINVVERLVVCEEFQLGNLREKMMEKLAAFPDALGIVSSNPDIMKHPKIMQELLTAVAFGTKKAPEAKPEEKKEKVEKVEKVEKAEKVEKVEKEKVEKAEKSEKLEKTEKVEKTEKLERVEKTDKVEKVEKAPEKQERPSAEKPPPAKKARKAGGA